MKIILNGEPVLVECDTERASIRLSENDLVEIIAPMAGG